MSFIKTVYFGFRKLTFLHSFLKTICFDSGFSEEVLYYTSGCAPSMPASPVLTKAGVTWLSLQWSKPSGTPSDEGISYILEMEEETSVSICILNRVFRTFQCDINPDTVNTAAIASSFPGPFETLVGYCLERTGSEEQLSLLLSQYVGGGFVFYVCVYICTLCLETTRTPCKYICFGENKERARPSQP